MATITATLRADASVESLDPLRFAENFAPDGTLEDAAGTQPVVGRQAIAEFFGNGLQSLGLVRVLPRIRAMYAGIGQSTEIMVSWELTAQPRTDKPVVVHGIRLFRFKPVRAGTRLLLESVREFYDPLALTTFVQ